MRNGKHPILRRAYAGARALLSTGAMAVLVGAAGLAASAHAQIPGSGEITPRAYILSLLDLNGGDSGSIDSAEQLDLEPAKIDAQDEIIETNADANPGANPGAKPGGEDDDPALKVEAADEAVLDDDLAEMPEAETPSGSGIVEDMSPAEMPAPYALLNPEIPAFFVGAEEYLAMRGDENGAQAKLVYTVSRAALREEGEDEEGEVTGNEVTVLLGDDYAASVRGDVTKIYDFKMGRLLTIKPAYDEAGEKTDFTIFDNTALYAGVYRNILAVEGVTEGGKVRQIEIGEDKTLDAFWVESAMSWAEGGKVKGLKTSSKKDRFSAVFDGADVASAEFSDMRLKRSFRASLIAFAHHEWGLHPKVLDSLEAYPNAPSVLVFHAYGPANPGGEAEKWELQSGDQEKAPFPLPKTALGAAQRTPIAPLVFVITEAVHGRALGGLPTPDGLKAAFSSAVEAGDDLASWQAGRRYGDYTGACAVESEDEVCAALAKLENTIFFNLAAEEGPEKKLSDYVTAMKMAKSSKTRAAAVKTLEPYLDTPETPAAVLRTLAMARSSLSADDAKAAGVANLSALGILETALAKDAYDPQTYLGLAQVLAANGALEQSWDVYDALRAGIPTAPAVELKIGGVETGIRERAPLFFGK